MKALDLDGRLIPEQTDNEFILDRIHKRAAEAARELAIAWEEKLVNLIESGKIKIDPAWTNGDWHVCEEFNNNNIQENR